jgi:hypothetical protein
LYDGHLIELYLDWFEENLVGGKVMVDGHFTIAKELLAGTDEKFITLVLKKSRKGARAEIKGGGNEDGEDLVVCTGEDADIAHVRARVEKNFAWAKNTFATLSTKYFGKPRELDCILYFAFGMSNFNIED